MEGQTDAYPNVAEVDSSLAGHCWAIYNQRMLDAQPASNEDQTILMDHDSVRYGKHCISP